jgi:hypothetical protein
MSTVRKENETREERERRHKERAQKVQSHRAGILRKGADGKPAPVTSSGSGAASSSSSSAEGLRKLHKKGDFICPIRFENTLPDLPVEQKYVAFPFDEDFITAYDPLTGVSSETAGGQVRAYHPEPDLDMGIPLIDPDTYTIPSAAERPPAHPLDAEITSAEYSRPAARRSDVGFDAGKVEWLMLSQHLHNDLYDAVYKHGDLVATQAMHLQRKKAHIESMYKGSRRERIEASFAACADDAVVLHPTNPTLQPARVWDLLPHPEAGGVEFVAVTFDADPDDAPERKLRKLPGLTPGQKRARVEHALIRTPATQAVALAERTVMAHLLLPVPEDMEAALATSKGAAGAGGGGGPVRMEAVRDYAMHVELGERGHGPGVGVGAVGVGEEILACTWDDVRGVVYFMPMKKRAQLVRTQSRVGASGANTGADVVVHRRPLRPEEEDQMEEWRAKVDEADPRPVLEEIHQRKKARIEAAKEKALERSSGGGKGAGAGSSSGSGSGAGAGGAFNSQGMDEDSDFDVEA